MEISGRDCEDDDVVVYTEMLDGSTIGLDISKCRGFIPKVGDKVGITIGLYDDFIEKRVKEN